MAQKTDRCVQSVVPRMWRRRDGSSLVRSWKLGPLGRRFIPVLPEAFSDFIQTVIRTVWPLYFSEARMHWPHHIHDPRGARPSGVKARRRLAWPLWVWLGSTVTE